MLILHCLSWQWKNNFVGLTFLRPLRPLKGGRWVKNWKFGPEYFQLAKACELINYFSIWFSVYDFQLPSIFFSYSNLFNYFFNILIFFTIFFLLFSNYFSRSQDLHLSLVWQKYCESRMKPDISLDWRGMDNRMLISKVNFTPLWRREHKV